MRGSLTFGGFSLRKSSGTPSLWAPDLFQMLCSINKSPVSGTEPWHYGAAASLVQGQLELQATHLILPPLSQ